MHVHTHIDFQYNRYGEGKGIALCSYLFYSQLYELLPTRLMMVHSYRHTIIIFSHKRIMYLNMIMYTHTETFNATIMEKVNVRSKLVLIYKIFMLDL